MRTKFKHKVINKFLLLGAGLTLGSFPISLVLSCSPLLGSIGKYDSISDNKVVIQTTWSSGGIQHTALQNVVNKYNETQKDTNGFMKVELQKVEGGYGAIANQLLTKIQSRDTRTLPNLYVDYPSSLGKVSPYGMFFDATKYGLQRNIFEEKFAKVNDGISGIKPGGLYSIPLARSTQGLILNKPLLKYIFEQLKTKGANIDYESGLIMMAIQKQEISSFDLTKIQSRIGSIKSDVTLDFNVIGEDIDSEGNKIVSSNKNTIDERIFSNYRSLFNFAIDIFPLFTNPGKITMMGFDSPSNLFYLLNSLYQKNNPNQFLFSKNDKTEMIDYHFLTKGNTIASSFQEIYNKFIEKALDANALWIGGGGLYGSTRLVEHQMAISVGSSAGLHYSTNYRNRTPEQKAQLNDDEAHYALPISKIYSNNNRPEGDTTDWSKISGVVVQGPSFNTVHINESENQAAINFLKWFYSKPNDLDSPTNLFSNKSGYTVPLKNNFKDDGVISRKLQTLNQETSRGAKDFYNLSNDFQTFIGVDKSNPTKQELINAIQNLNITFNKRNVLKILYGLSVDAINSWEIKAVDIKSPSNANYTISVVKNWIKNLIRFQEWPFSKLALDRNTKTKLGVKMSYDVIKRQLDIIKNNKSDTNVLFNTAVGTNTGAIRDMIDSKLRSSLDTKQNTGKSYTAQRVWNDIYNQAIINGIIKGDIDKTIYKYPSQLDRNFSDIDWDFYTYVDAEIVSWTDGDTLKVKIKKLMSKGKEVETIGGMQKDNQVSIRITGIDTPEATAKLSQIKHLDTDANGNNILRTLTEDEARTLIDKYNNLNKPLAVKSGRFYNELSNNPNERYKYWKNIRVDIRTPDLKQPHIYVTNNGEPLKDEKKPNSTYNLRSATANYKGKTISFISNIALKEGYWAHKSYNIGSKLLPKGTNVRIATLGNKSYNRYLGSMFYDDKQIQGKKRIGELTYYNSSWSINMIKMGLALPLIKNPASIIEPHNIFWEIGPAMADELARAIQKGVGLFNKEGYATINEKLNTFLATHGVPDYSSLLKTTTNKANIYDYLKYRNPERIKNND